MHDVVELVEAAVLILCPIAIWVLLLYASGQAQLVGAEE